MNNDRECAKDWNVKGMRYAELENWEVAKRYFEKCVEVDPENGEYLNNLGLLYCNQCRYAESILIFERAIVCSPHEGHFWLSLGHASYSIFLLKKLSLCCLFSFPFFSGNRYLFHYSFQEINTDLFFMWIGYCEYEIILYHIRVLSSLIGSFKSKRVNFFT